MEIKNIKTFEEIIKLKVGDKILVEWSDYRIKHTPEMKKIETYIIEKIFDFDKEIICNGNKNHYFNYEMYVFGKSSALDIYLISTEEVE